MFGTHKLNDTGFKEVGEFKAVMAAAMRSIDSFIPTGREKAIFTTKIEEAVFFGTRAIASKPENHTEIVEF